MRTSTRAQRGASLLELHEKFFLGETAAPRPLGHIGLSPKEIREYSLIHGALGLAAAMSDRPNLGADFAEQSATDAARRRGRPSSLELDASRAVAKSIGREPAPGRLLVPLEILQRDMTAAGSSGSNYLVSTSPAGFIPALRAASVTRRLGATVVGPLRDNAVMPKAATGATTTWLSDEAAPIDETQPVLGQLGLVPKTVGALVNLSHQLTRQISPQAEALLVGDLGAAVGAAVDAAALAGTGTLGEPLGLLSTSGLGAFTGASLDYAAVLNAQSDVATANGVVNADACGYVTTPTVSALLKVRHKTASTHSPIWEGPVHAGRIDDMPALATTGITAATAIYGDWSNLLIGEWGILEIMANPFGDFSRGIISLRALWTVDVGVRNAAGFSIATSIT